MGARAFRQCDVTRALKAGAAAGVEVAVRIDRLTGDLYILPASLTPSVKPAPSGDSPEELLDAWLAENGDG